MLQSFDLSDLRNMSGETKQDLENRLRTLMELALSFDPIQWLLEFTPTSPDEDLSKRFHIASAHRSAVFIYLARFVPSTNPLLNPEQGTALGDLEEHAGIIIHHISQLSPGDVIFKSISWPLFLAGAETNDPKHRAWILCTLDTFYHILHWGYVQSVVKTLKAIWTFRDGAPKENDSDCWVLGVQAMESDILIA